MNNLTYKSEWIKALMEARRLHIRYLRNHSREELRRLGTSGTCPEASLLLHATLLKHDATCQPSITDGFYDTVKKGHLWVRAMDEQGQLWDLDVTADQFGAQRLTCTPCDSDSPYLNPRPIEQTDPIMVRWIEELGEGGVDPQIRINRLIERFHRMTP